jgi:hypothetical protein
MAGAPAGFPESWWGCLRISRAIEYDSDTRFLQPHNAATAPELFTLDEQIECWRNAGSAFEVNQGPFTRQIPDSAVEALAEVNDSGLQTPTARRDSRVTHQANVAGRRGQIKALSSALP